MARLAGKVAFITSGRIGRATAECFAEEGAKVIIAEINPETGSAAAEAARAGIRTPAATPYPCNATCTSARRLIAAIKRPMAAKYAPHKIRVNAIAPGA